MACREVLKAEHVDPYVNFRDVGQVELGYDLMVREFKNSSTTKKADSYEF